MLTLACWVLQSGVNIGKLHSVHMDNEIVRSGLLGVLLDVDQDTTPATSLQSSIQCSPMRQYAAMRALKTTSRYRDGS